MWSDVTGVWCGNCTKVCVFNDLNIVIRIKIKIGIIVIKIKEIGIIVIKKIKEIGIIVIEFLKENLKIIKLVIWIFGYRQYCICLVPFMLVCAIKPERSGTNPSRFGGRDVDCSHIHWKIASWIRKKEKKKQDQVEPEPGTSLIKDEPVNSVIKDEPVGRVNTTNSRPVGNITEIIDGS